MTFAGVTENAGTILAILVKQHRPDRFEDFKNYVLTCGGLGAESFTKVESDEMTPVQGFVLACHRGFRPSFIYSGLYVSILPVNICVNGALCESAGKLFIGVRVKCLKPGGVTHLISLNLQFPDISLSNIRTLLSEVLGFQIAEVHQYFEVY